MSRFPLFAALSLIAIPATGLAQTEPAQAPTAPPATPGPEAAIQQAATAFAGCVTAGTQSVAATVTPEAGAASVLAGCAAQRRQLDQAVEALIATLPEDQRAAAQAQVQTQMGVIEPQVIAAIREQRAAPAQAPAAAGH